MVTKRIKSFHIAIKFFSTSPVLRVGEDIFSKIDDLLMKRKNILSHIEASKIDRENHEKALEENKYFKEKVFSQLIELKRHIREGSPWLNKEEQEKIIKNNNEFTPTQVLVKEKLDKLDENDPSNTLELIKLQILFNRSVVKKLEFVDSIVDSAVIREQKNIPDFKLDYYYGIRAKILNNLFKFKEEESAYASRQKKLLESLDLSKNGKGPSPVDGGDSAPIENANKETPTEFIANKMMEDMPSYTDPED